MIAHAQLYGLLGELRKLAQDQSLIDGLNDMQQKGLTFNDQQCRDVLLDAWEFCMHHTCGDESAVRRKADYYGERSPFGRVYELENPVMLVTKLKGLIERKYAEGTR